MSQTISYDEIDPFKKDFKALQKRYRTLPEDLENLKKHALELFHNQKIDSQAIVPVPGFNNEKAKIYKIRKFACKALKGKGANSGIRIIYTFQPDNKLLTFIEIYFKADKENEDKERISAFLKTFS